MDMHMYRLIVLNSLLILSRRLVVLSPRTANNSLNTVKTHLQNFHLGAVAQADKVVARAVEQITSLGRVQVEEDTGHDNDLLGQKRIEEVQSIGYVSFLGKGRVERGQVKPDVEGCLRDVLDAETDFVKTLEDKVSLLAEVALKRLHFCVYERGLKHGDSGFLEGSVGATVEIGTCGSKGIYEFFGTDNPGNTPTRQTETLCETVDQKDVYFR